MKIKIKKFGGTSLSNTILLQNAAEIIKQDIDKGFNVVVVVSAIAGHTNILCNKISQIGFGINSREEDVVLSSGEQINAGLMAIMLNKININARSFLGWQLPIITTSNHTNANIINIDITKIKECFTQNTVPIITGFNGMDINQNITTLGRGGSDFTATALAHALNAEKCEIYTDIDGVYTADPKIVKNAYKIPEISYEVMLEATILGAKIMHYKSVTLAMSHLLKTEIISSFSNNSGTILVEDCKNLNTTLLSSRKDILAFFIDEHEIKKFTDTPNLYIAQVTKNNKNNNKKAIIYGMRHNLCPHTIQTIRSYSIQDDLAEISIIKNNINNTSENILKIIKKHNTQQIIGYLQRKHSICLIVKKSKIDQILNTLHDSLHYFTDQLI